MDTDTMQTTPPTATGVLRLPLRPPQVARRFIALSYEKLGIPLRAQGRGPTRVWSLASMRKQHGIDGVLVELEHDEVVFLP